MERVVLRGLKPDSYEHVWDINAKAMLRSIPLLESAVKKLNESFSDKVIVMEHKASYLEISERQYSRIYAIFADCCKILDVPQPPLFLIRNDDINAYTMGISTPLVCITSGCVQYLSEEELRFIMGHELGHIKSQHLLYRSLALWLQKGGNEILIGTGGIFGVMAVVSLNSALYKWTRMSEFTADRAGLLCVQNIKSSTSALAKLAGFLTDTEDVFNVEEFMEQAKRFNRQYENGPEALMANVRIMLGDVTHPYTVSRVYELNDWYNKGEYERISGIENPEKLEFNKTCPSCGCKDIPPALLICPNCKTCLV